MDSGESAVEQIGAYRVVRKVAGAASSEVLLAKADGPLGSERSVILKVFAGRDGDEVSRTFAREAAAYCRVSHATVVRLLDFFALPPTSHRAGQLCMVLEHVEGPSLVRLRTLLKSAAQELDDRASIYVAANIFEALSFAHSITPETPLVHRDVNPSSVLIAWDGQVKVTDFGFAKVSDASHDAKGTYGYLAPEQAKGLEPTPRADIYSAGLILWELLAKRKAFQRGALPEEEAIRAMAEPRLPAVETLRSDLHPAVVEVLRRTLDPRVEQRTITAEEAAAMLSGSIVMDDGREQLANALGAVRASDSTSNSLAPRLNLPERRPITSIPPPATKRGVAPPSPPSSSDAIGPVSATDPFARTTPMDAFEIERRPPPPSPRRSVVDAGPVKGKSATQRLSIAIPDAPALQKTLVMAPNPAQPEPPAAAPAVPDANEGTQPLTRTLALPDRPPLPPRSVPPLSLPEVAISAPVRQVANPSSPPERPRPAPAPARNRALPVVVTLAIVGIGIVVAYARSQPSAVLPPEDKSVTTVTTAPSVEPTTPATASEATLTKEDTTAAVATALAPEPAPPAPASASASPASPPSGSEAADEGTLAADMGRIRTAGAVAGRRIFVDDKTVGQTPASVVVKCGRHTVKLGSAGKPQTLDVPCRGDVSFAGR